MKNNPKVYKFFTIVILLFMGVNILNAQLRIDSPYSRYGLGDINNGYNAYQSGMGGVGYGVIDPLRISTLNPASYSFIDSSSFVFNAAFEGMGIKTHTQTQTGTSNYFNLNYLKLATPITRWWKMSLGILPYSTVGYNVNIYSKVDSIGDVRYGYLGDGGINRFYLGSGFKLTNNLSLGVNLSYLFGNINLRRETHLLDINKSFDYRITNTLTTKAIYFDYGLQYRNYLNINSKKYFYGLGLSYANEQQLNATYSAFGYTYTDGSDGYEFVKDTIVNQTKGEGYIVIPQKLGAGFSFGQIQKWMIAADFTFNEWSKFTSFGISENLTNSINYNIGGQYSIKNWLLNAGFRYNNTALNLNNTPINEYGISFGVGIPLSQKSNPPSTSFVDLSFEYGRRGTTENNLIMQEYYKIRMGINIKNTWFQRTKYL